MSFVFNNVTDKLLIKRFREQFLFGRFEGLDIESEILNRMERSKKQGNKELLDDFRNEVINGQDAILLLQKKILNRMEGQ